MSMRIRITFSKTSAMRYTSHLDLHRAWERTLRRAELPLAYSQGFNPRPKINLASALPLGFTSEYEVIDVRLEKDLPLEEIAVALERSLPPGLHLNEITEIDLKAPVLQSQLLASEIEITFLDPFPDLEERIRALLYTHELPRERRGKAYDLCPLIEDLHLMAEDSDGCQRLFARLSAREGATARPEEVVDALGYDPLAARVHRTRIIFQEEVVISSQFSAFSHQSMVVSSQLFNLGDNH